MIKWTCEWCEPSKFVVLRPEWCQYRFCEVHKCMTWHWPKIDIGFQLETFEDVMTVRPSTGTTDVATDGDDILAAIKAAKAKIAEFGPAPTMMWVVKMPNVVDWLESLPTPYQRYDPHLVPLMVVRNDAEVESMHCPFSDPGVYVMMADGTIEVYLRDDS